MDTNQIKRVLNTLDEDEETIKILYYFIQRLTESQIATRVGPSEGTVRSRLHNISAKMSAGYVLNDETPGDPLDPKYRFITGEVETVVLDALGRDTPDWSKFPFDISVPGPVPRPLIEAQPTANGANRLNIAIWGILAVFFLFGGWRFIQLVVWDCNPFTSNILCGVVSGVDGEEVAEVNPTPSPHPTIDTAAEETRIQALVNEGLTSQAPTPVTPDPTGTERAIQTEAAQRIDQILTETALAIPTETPSNTPTPTVTPTPSITPTPSETPTITPIPPLLFDDFEDGNFAGWSAESGDWVIDEADDGNHGLMCLRKGIISRAGENWDNYTVSADVKFVTESGVIGIMGRRSGDGLVNYYRADLLAENSARLGSNVYVTYIRADWNVIQSVNFPINTGQVYNIELRMYGVQITMLIDGEVMVDVVRDRHIKGGIGLFCGDSTIAVLDNVLVERLGN